MADCDKKETVDESVEETTPEVKNGAPVAEEKPSVWLIILSILIPFVGLVYWLVCRKKDTKRAELYCMIAIISLIVGEIVSIGFTISRVSSIVSWVLSLFGG